MEILRIDPDITAFIRTDEGANVGLIHTPAYGLEVARFSAYCASS